MATKPTKKTDWATDPSALKVDPSATQETFGWSTSDNTINGQPVKPNLQNQNGWQNNVHQWVAYLEAQTDENLAAINNVAQSVIPLGGIIAVASNLTGAFDSASGVVTNGFQLCDGVPIPGGNAVTGSVPQLTDNRFLMGSSTAGVIGGNANNEIDINHSHGVSSVYCALSLTNPASGTNTWEFNDSLSFIDGSWPFQVDKAISGISSVSITPDDATNALATFGNTDPAPQYNNVSILPLYLTVKYFMRVN